MVAWLCAFDCSYACVFVGLRACLCVCVLVCLLMCACFVCYVFVRLLVCLDCACLFERVCVCVMNYM